jgi:thioredoxin reductase (NADPH)
LAADPVLLVVDDEPDVLRAVQRDLRRRFGDSYRIVAAGSGADALATVRELRERNEALALMLVDQRMPGMSGVEFMAQAIELFAGAKRVLLTAYADTQVAIDAINLVGLDYYILKPWHPPEERLYPIVEDLLGDWAASYQRPYEGVTVVGLRWSPDSHKMRDFLARNQVPYRWWDVESSEEGRRLAEQSRGARLPLVVLPNGERHDGPTNAELAQALGLFTPLDPNVEPFDLVIVGAGPAGLAAAVYGASEGLTTGLVERDAPGGQAGQSSRIENYLGFPKGLSGAELSRRALTQARRFGVTLLCPAEATELRFTEGYSDVSLADGSVLRARALIVATGVSYRRLDVPGAAELEGLGVYYGGTAAEAEQCATKDIVIVGGANSAGQAAVYFAEHARSVHLVIRSDSPAESMSQYLVTQLEAMTNLAMHTNTEVTAVHGDGHLEGVTLTNKRTGEVDRMAAGGVFVFIGAQPYTEWLAGSLARDRHGFLLTGPDMLQATDGWSLPREPFLLESSAPGVFAAGDVRANAIRRVASAVGEGSIAVQFVHRLLAST